LKFELIDRVIDHQEDRITAVKCISSAEEYLADHFPGFPVLPGVLMLEALVQAGCRLLADRSGNHRLVLSEVRNVRYGSMVRPGQSLTGEVSRRKASDEGWELEGTGSVEKQVAIQGRFRLEPLKPLEAI
jgi:3-hydroxyacyl-[acyl-carrier-protein] dehydratase